jgi:hypothetical protein
MRLREELVELEQLLMQTGAIWDPHGGHDPQNRTPWFPELAALFAAVNAAYRHLGARAASAGPFQQEDLPPESRGLIY